jgi:transcription elongation factor Elf1
MTVFRFKCPHCKTEIAGKSSMDQVFMARKTCGVCGKEFLIVDDVPMTDAEYEARQQKQ